MTLRCSCCRIPPPFLEPSVDAALSFATDNSKTRPSSGGSAFAEETGGHFIIMEAGADDDVGAADDVVDAVVGKLMMP